MCKYTNQACPGGFIAQTSSYTSWFCPGGNDYVCCKNAGPSANAGSDKTITLPTNSVTLSGSCSDSDSDSRNLKSCTWTKESGSGGSIASPSSGSTSVTGLTQGTYVFKLTASDGYASSSDTVSVTVNASANKAPSANAGADITISLPTNNVSVTGTGTDSDGTIASYSWTKTAGPSGGTIADSSSGTTTITELVEGVYKFALKVTDDKGATDTDDVQVTVNRALLTTFSFDLLFHGIGKGGDNKNPAGGGNPAPLHPTRSVVVDVYDLDNNPVVTGKEGQVTFDPVAGSYKGDVVVGTTLNAQPYVIKAKLSHSLRGTISRNIQVGTTNVIPVMKLVNGDTNNDARLDIEDYNIILGCYSDFDLPPADCNVTKRLQADIDDDNKVNQFDLNLFLREMSVQEL